MLKEFVLKTDAQYLLSSKVSIDEVRSLMDNKASQAETKSEINILNNKLEEFQQEFLKKIPNFVSQKDLDKVLTIIDSKADLAEINTALETKANKNSVASALHK